MTDLTSTMVGMNWRLQRPRLGELWTTYGRCLCRSHVVYWTGNEARCLDCNRSRSALRFVRRSEETRE